MQMYYYISSLKGKGEKLYANHVIRGAQFLLFNQKVLVITYNRSQESQNTYGVLQDSSGEKGWPHPARSALRTHP